MERASQPARLRRNRGVRAAAARNVRTVDVFKPPSKRPTERTNEQVEFRGAVQKSPWIVRELVELT